MTHCRVRDPMVHPAECIEARCSEVKDGSYILDDAASVVVAGGSFLRSARSDKQVASRAFGEAH